MRVTVIPIVARTHHCIPSVPRNFSPDSLRLFPTVRKMPSVARLAARVVLLQPLPSLIIGQNHTTSSAIHRVDFVGTLLPWPNFERDVIAAFTSQTTSIDVIISGIGTIDSVSREKLVLGDETGL
ncbi:hypothetical protein VN97_g12152 [Penicillium thymicola]|uniref:Uncharacterized protein n=1 Tax=Penicillium thymicola TaxID=293382 RepID=A0AAI9X2I6_PENTH|nr:hypothetical protein VN97_g12152 [Penicillium thymicola]